MSGQAGRPGTAAHLVEPARRFGPGRDRTPGRRSAKAAPSAARPGRGSCWDLLGLCLGHDRGHPLGADAEPPGEPYDGVASRLSQTALDPRDGRLVDASQVAECFEAESAAE